MAKRRIKIVNDDGSIEWVEIDVPDEAPTPPPADSSAGITGAEGEFWQPPPETPPQTPPPPRAAPPTDSFITGGEEEFWRPPPPDEEPAFFAPERPVEADDDDEPFLTMGEGLEGLSRPSEGDGEPFFVPPPPEELTAPEEPEPFIPAPPEELLLDQQAAEQPPAPPGTLADFSDLERLAALEEEQRKQIELTESRLAALDLLDQERNAPIFAPLTEEDYRRRRPWIGGIGEPPIEQQVMADEQNQPEMQQRPPATQGLTTLERLAELPDLSEYGINTPPGITGFFGDVDNPDQLVGARANLEDWQQGAQGMVAARDQWSRPLTLDDVPDESKERLPLLTQADLRAAIAEKYPDLTPWQLTQAVNLPANQQALREMNAERTAANQKADEELNALLARANAERAENAGIVQGNIDAANRQFQIDQIRRRTQLELEAASAGRKAQATIDAGGGQTLTLQGRVVGGEFVPDEPVRITDDEQSAILRQLEDQGINAVRVRQPQDIGLVQQAAGALLRGLPKLPAAALPGVAAVQAARPVVPNAIETFITQSGETLIDTALKPFEWVQDRSMEAAMEVQIHVPDSLIQSEETRELKAALRELPRSERHKYVTAWIGVQPLLDIFGDDGKERQRQLAQDIRSGMKPEDLNQKYANFINDLAFGLVVDPLNVLGPIAKGARALTGLAPASEVLGYQSMLERRGAAKAIAHVSDADAIAPWDKRALGGVFHGKGVARDASGGIDFYGTLLGNATNASKASTARVTGITVVNTLEDWFNPQTGRGVDQMEQFVRALAAEGADAAAPRFINQAPTAGVQTIRHVAPELVSAMDDANTPLAQAFAKPVYKGTADEWAVASDATKKAFYQNEHVKAADVLGEIFDTSTRITRSKLGLGEMDAAAVSAQNAIRGALSNLYLLNPRYYIRNALGDSTTAFQYGTSAFTTPGHLTELERQLGIIFHGQTQAGDISAAGRSRVPVVRQFRNKLASLERDRKRTITALTANRSFIARRNASAEIGVELVPERLRPYLLANSRAARGVADLEKLVPAAGNRADISLNSRYVLDDLLDGDLAPALERRLDAIVAKAARGEDVTADINKLLTDAADHARTGNGHFNVQFSEADLRRVRRRMAELEAEGVPTREAMTRALGEFAEDHTVNIRMVQKIRELEERGGGKFGPELTKELRELQARRADVLRQTGTTWAERRANDQAHIQALDNLLVKYRTLQNGIGLGGPKAVNGYKTTDEVIRALEQRVEEARRAVREADLRRMRDPRIGPNRYYHGSGAAFDEPRAEYFDFNGLYGPGFYVTDNPRVASSYATLSSRAGREGAAPNVRPVDLPDELNLLDTRYPVPAAEVARIQAHVDRIGGFAADAFDDALPTGVISGDDIYRALERAGEGDREWVNIQLQELGYHGVTHQGGIRRPIRGPQGEAVTHTAVALFENALPVIRSAKPPRYKGPTFADADAAIARRRLGQAERELAAERARRGADATADVDAALKGAKGNGAVDGLGDANAATQGAAIATENAKAALYALLLGERLPAALTDFNTVKSGLGQLTPQEIQGIRQYIAQQKQALSRDLVAARTIGRRIADEALHNYERTYDYDYLLRWIAPWELWTSRTLAKTPLRMADHPAYYSKFAALRDSIRDTNSDPKLGIPEHLRDRVRIPMPYLPDWLGEEVYFDPVKLFLPTDLLQNYVAQEERDTKIGQAKQIMGMVGMSPSPLVDTLLAMLPGGKKWYDVALGPHSPLSSLWVAGAAAARLAGADVPIRPAATDAQFRETQRLLMLSAVEEDWDEARYTDAMDDLAKNFTERGVLEGRGLKNKDAQTALDRAMQAEGIKSWLSLFGVVGVGFRDQGRVKRDELIDKYFEVRDTQGKEAARQFIRDNPDLKTYFLDGKTNDQLQKEVATTRYYSGIEKIHREYREAIERLPLLGTDIDRRQEFDKRERRIRELGEQLKGETPDWEIPTRPARDLPHAIADALYELPMVRDINGVKDYEAWLKQRDAYLKALEQAPVTADGQILSDYTPENLRPAVEQALRPTTPDGAAKAVVQKIISEAYEARAKAGEGAKTREEKARKEAEFDKSWRMPDAVTIADRMAKEFPELFGPPGGRIPLTGGGRYTMEEAYKALETGVPRTLAEAGDISEAGKLQAFRAALDERGVSAEPFYANKKVGALVKTQADLDRYLKAQRDADEYTARRAANDPTYTLYDTAERAWLFGGPAAVPLFRQEQAILDQALGPLLPSGVRDGAHKNAKGWQSEFRFPDGRKMKAIEAYQEVQKAQAKLYDAQHAGEPRLPSEKDDDAKRQTAGSNDTARNAPRAPSGRRGGATTPRDPGPTAPSVKWINDGVLTKSSLTRVNQDGTPAINLREEWRKGLGMTPEKFDRLAGRYPDVQTAIARMEAMRARIFEEGADQNAVTAQLHEEALRVQEMLEKAQATEKERAAGPIAPRVPHIDDAWLQARRLRGGKTDFDRAFRLGTSGLSTPEKWAQFKGNHPELAAAITALQERAKAVVTDDEAPDDAETLNALYEEVSRVAEMITEAQVADREALTEMRKAGAELREEQQRIARERVAGPPRPNINGIDDAWLAPRRLRGGVVDFDRAFRLGSGALASPSAWGRFTSANPEVRQAISGLQRLAKRLQTTAEVPDDAEALASFYDDVANVAEIIYNARQREREQQSANRATTAQQSRTARPAARTYDDRGDYAGTLEEAYTLPERRRRDRKRRAA